MGFLIPHYQTSRFPAPHRRFFDSARESPLSPSPGYASSIFSSWTVNINGTRVGPLFDVIHEALIRVVAGADAPTRPVELAEVIV